MFFQNRGRPQGNINKTGNRDFIKIYFPEVIKFLALTIAEKSLLLLEVYTIFEKEYTLTSNQTGHNSSSKCPFDILTSALDKIFRDYSFEHSPEAQILKTHTF